MLLLNFEEQIKKIQEVKLQDEANVVSIIYKKPEVLFDLDLTIDSFTHNEWKVYYAIAYDLIVGERKQVLDDVTVGLYLEKHPKLMNKYKEYGGFDTIKKATKYVKEENLFGYVNQLNKWNAILETAKSGIYFHINFNDLIDMDIEEVYTSMDAAMQNGFLKRGGKIASYDVSDGLDELIEKLNKGSAVGLPFHNANILTDEVGGFNLDGNIYGLGASTGVGKSTTAINYLLPSVIKFKEPIVIAINEEDKEKIQKELLVWISNNLFNGYIGSDEKRHDVHKKDLRNGHFSKELLEILLKAKDKLEELTKGHLITIIPFEKYTCKDMIKVIKKYSSMGVRMFVLDTFKESSDINVQEQTWKAMERDMRELYDVVKPASRNVGLFVTYQLAKNSVKTRKLTNYDVGQSKNILDVISVNIMMRKPFEDEYEGGKKEIMYFEKGKSAVKKALKREQNYMITFITKNRFGESGSYEIVSEYDLSTNRNRDLGICYVQEDF